MDTQAPQAPPGWYDEPAGTDRQRYWDGQQWTENYQGPPGEPPTKPTKPWHRKWWVWVLGGLVVLGIIGALIPAEESDKSKPSAAAQQKAESPKPKPKEVVLNATAPEEVRKPTAVIKGTVTPATADVTVDGKRVEVSGGTFRYRLKLRQGVNYTPIEATAHGYGPYAASVSIYRNLTKAEIAEQNRIIAERRARERAERRARAEAKKQEFIASAQTIDYDQLMKNPEAFAGDPVKYTGQIFQIQEDPAGGGIVLLAVTDEGYGFWTDNIWVNYDGKVQGAEEDMLTVYGTVVGSKTYETQIGGETYVPEIDAKIIDE
jgi:hypothetical protein